MDQIIIFLDALAIFVLVFCILVEVCLMKQHRVLNDHKIKSECPELMLALLIPIVISAIWLIN